MARFEDTPGLFGNGMGSVSHAGARCDLCSTDYPEGHSDHDPGVATEQFAGLDICDCCFERIEVEVLGRMDLIIPWFIRIVQARRKLVEGQEQMLADLKKTMIA